MNYQVPMPSLGADMDEGKVMQWKIHPGDEIKKGQTIAVVETTKSAVEIESFYDGKVLELIGKIGEMISVGKPIALFDIQESTLPLEAVHPASSERIKISPAARKLSELHHLSIESLKGSGPDGLIELKDVELAAAQRTPAAGGVNLRAAIAKAMSQSKKEIPHFYLKSRFCLDSLLEWIDEKNKFLPAEKRLLLPVMLMRAVSLTLKEFPILNGYFKEGVFVKQENINLGMAFALKSGGVLVPAILETQSMSLQELNSAFLDLALRTQKNELKNRELTEGTITITNMGDLGSDEVFGVIFPPQVALIGLGRLHKAPWVLGEVIKASWVMDISLSADHRVTDGLSGAGFLRKLEEKFIQPNLLGE